MGFRETRTAGCAFSAVFDLQSDVRRVAQSLDMHLKFVEYVAFELSAFAQQ